MANTPHQTATAKAPGRMDVMGGIADYSGAWVLQMPIAQQTQVAISLNQQSNIVLKSQTESESFAAIEVNTDAVYANHPGALRSALAAMPGSAWAAYVLGGFQLLAQKGFLSHKPGANIVVNGAVPVGKGVSSSAALEVATLRALAQLTPWQPTGTELPRLAQQIENQVVGAPCGLMDQLASHMGVSGHLLPILCQPDVVEKPIKIPTDVHFVGIDSMVAHSVGGASYGQVRTAAFMAMAMVALQKGATVTQLNQAGQSGQTNGLPYGGHLANISPSEWLTNFEQQIPTQIKGHTFNEQVAGYPDAATQINPDQIYYPRVCAQHPIMENYRVQLFKQLLLGYNTTNAPTTLQLMGELMYQAHQSYSACGLGHPDTDALVDMAKQAGPQSGVYGAKITGGGSGGTVCLLVHGTQGYQTALSIKEKYAKTKGKQPAFFG